MNVDLPVLASLLPSNDRHLDHCFRLIQKSKSRKVGILGLAFKAGTDDLRESPMVRLVETLLGKGYQVKIYDRTVSLSRVIGANKRYIEEVLPHISELMVSDLDEILRHSESIIIGDNAPELRGFLERLNGSHQIIDLVGDDRLMAQCDGNYEGVCW